MSVGSDWTTEAALSAFDDHLRRARGLCAETRTGYARFVTRSWKSASRMAG